MSDPLHMKRRSAFRLDTKLAQLFVLLGVLLASLIAAYWFLVLEPRLTENARASADALAQAQSHILARVIGNDGDVQMAANLETEMAAILLIQDTASGVPFVSGLEVAVDYDLVHAPLGSLDVRHGDMTCDDCFTSEIPLYHPIRQTLIGIATFHSSPRMLQDLIADVQQKLLWGGLITLLLIGVAWTWARRLVQRLRQGEANLRGLFEAAPFPMLLMQGEGQVRQANEAAVRYLSLASARSGGGLDSEDWRRLLDIGIPLGEAKPQEVALEGADSPPRHLLLSSISVWLSGAPAQLISLVDITPLKRVQDELSQAKSEAESATKAKSAFLATMSHEIRTPLNAIIGMTHLLTKVPLPEEQRQGVEMIRLAGDALLSLVNDILDFSQIESGRLELRPVDFDMGELAAGTAALFSYRAQEKGLKLETVIDPVVLRHYIGDDRRIRQVLINLLGNAVKFTDSGFVRVEARLALQEETRDLVELRVIDSGIGICADSLPKLFDEFTQSDDQISRRYGGTGLGLSISQRLVHLMGGEIGVESEPGKGSAFWVSLPLPHGVGYPDTEESGAVPPVSAGRQLRLLVVDDEPLNRRVLNGLLKDSGHLVSEAENGLQALESIEASAFDLVLLDLRMPVMDGIETARRIRSHEDASRARVPIVALTADVTTQAAEECKAAGIDEVAAKPLMPDVLSALLMKYSHQGTNC